MSMCTKRMGLPPISSQAFSRSPMVVIGVSDSTSRSMSILRRLRLSTINTSWP